MFFRMISLQRKGFEAFRANLKVEFMVKLRRRLLVSKCFDGLQVYGKEERRRRMRLEVKRRVKGEVENRPLQKREQINEQELTMTNAFMIPDST